MKRLFQFWLLIFVVVAFLGTVVVSWFVQTNSLRNSALDVLRVSLQDVELRLEITQKSHDIFKGVTNDAEIARARTWAKIVELHPECLEDPERMEEVAKMLGVDELHVADENGILVASYPPTYKTPTGEEKPYVGYDMASSPQSGAFMPAIKDKDFELVQETKAKGIDNRQFFRYAGVARRDKPGIVQVGVSPEVVTEAAALSDYSNVIRSFHVGQKGQLQI